MSQYIIPGILLSLTLFFGYLYVTGPIGGSPDSFQHENSAGTIPYNRVQNLKEQTKVRIDLKKQQAELAKTGERPLLDPEADKRNSCHTLSLNDDYGPAARDLDSRRSTDPLTLDQKMDEFLAKKQRYAELEKRQKQEFVRRFIEESKQMGYDVQINDQMEIVSVRKIGE